jgi:NAD(P)-dependent dehydrogenase (short-subunit alcohol dehydrogenase family)
MRLKDRVAIVTGAGRRGGIGEAIALRLAEEGAHVVVVDVCGAATASGQVFGQWDELRSIAAGVGASGRRGLAVKADLLMEDDVVSMVDQTMETFGRIDILCNNAAGGRGAGPIEPINVVDISLEDWRYTVDVNLTPTFLCSKHVARRMIEGGGGGAIINTSSIAARRTSPGVSGYTAGKLGVIGLTRSLAVELAAHGIRVNGISPGVTDTPWVQQRVSHISSATGVTRDQMLTQWVSAIPLRRTAAPAEMAGVVAFLASDDASYLTGQTISVDGGLVPD